MHILCSGKILLIFLIYYFLRRIKILESELRQRQYTIKEQDAISDPLEKGMRLET